MSGASKYFGLTFEGGSFFLCPVSIVPTLLTFIVFERDLPEISFPLKGDVVLALILVTAPLPDWFSSSLSKSKYVFVSKSSYALYSFAPEGMPSPNSK